MRRVFLLCALLASTATAGTPLPAGVVVREDRIFQLAVPGVEFQAGWSATIERDGHTQTLTSTDGVVTGGSEKAIRFPDTGVELLFRLEQATDAPAVFVQAGIRNIGSMPVRLVSVTAVSAEVQAGDDWSKWLVTGLHPATPVLVALSDIHSPLTVHEYGGCYRQDGTGFLFGPNGTPTAYLNAQFGVPGADKVAVTISADMSGARVDPGETRWGQQVALVFEQPQTALKHWTGWVAQSHGACTSKGALTGWNNAHPLKKRAIREDLADVIDAVNQSNGQLRLGLIQIEDAGAEPGNRSVLDAPWVPGCAERVREIGARFGIRLGFDKTADHDTVIETIRRAVQKGFTYLKIDRSAAGFAREEKQTGFEARRKQISAIRLAAGEAVYLSYSDDAPDRAVVGLVDASRVGREAKRENLRPAIEDLLRSYPLCGRWFVADVDNIYLADWKDNESQIQAGGGEDNWKMARLWISLAALAGANAVTSDPLYQRDFRQYWKNLEKANPPSKESISVLDLCKQREWPCLAGEVKRDWGEWLLALIWNPGDIERNFKFDFAKAGLQQRRKYAVWGIWDNRLLGIAQDSWSTHWLRKPDHEMIRITEWDSGSACPILIGSSLHFTCGNAEIKRIKASRSEMAIDLTNAGLSYGDLYIHSRFPPVLRNTAGCTVEGISLVGENAWRIGIRNRDWKVPQRIELAFLLPLTQQVWFWIAILTVATSMIFALWRYIVSLRAQRQTGLAEERARIAQDLHDDLGASLARLAYHGDALLDKPGLNAEEAEHADTMRRIARGTSRSLDEIVWAVDPKQDTLESFAGYLSSLAQELLSEAGLRCRFDFPDDLHDRPLSSRNRHHIFLAYKEALLNIIRHARAKEVLIRLTIGEKESQLEINDDGCGFDPSTAPGRPGGGHGLASLRNRMEIVGGRCEMESRPGAGTRIRFTWKTKS